MTVRTKTALESQITTLLADNDAGDISEGDVRSVLTDMLDSLEFAATANHNRYAAWSTDRHRGRLGPNGRGIVHDQHPDSAHGDGQSVPGACGGLTPMAGTSLRCISLGRVIAVTSLGLRRTSQ